MEICESAVAISDKQSSTIRRYTPSPADQGFRNLKVATSRACHRSWSVSGTRRVVIGERDWPSGPLPPKLRIAQQTVEHALHTASVARGCTRAFAYGRSPALSPA